MKKSLTILLPAYNEARAIGRLLDEIKDTVLISYDLLVIDNASTDSTLRITLDSGTTVLQVANKGKGNAIRESIRTIDTPYTIMMNSDLTYPPQFIKLIYQELVKGADVVLGTRALVDKGAMSLVNSMGNWGLSFLASILYGQRVNDLCTGMWGFRTSALHSFVLTSAHFTLEADLFINAIRHKCKIRQVPIAYRARLDGDRPKLKFSDGLKIGWFLLKHRIRR